MNEKNLITWPFWAVSLQNKEVGLKMESCCFEGLESAWIWITATTEKNLKWIPKYLIMGMLNLYLG